MHFFHICNAIAALALSAITTYASPLSKRGTVVKSGAGTAVVQWSSDYNTVNHMRNYHIDAGSNQVVESFRDGSGAWQSRQIGIKARPGGPLVAGVYKYSEAANDVEIRIFYQGPNKVGRDRESKTDIYRMMSATKARNNATWTFDKQFYDQVGYAATPMSVVNWYDAKAPVSQTDRVQWRLYFVSSKQGQDWDWLRAAASIFVDDPEAAYEWYSFNTIYEAQLSSASRTWSMGNGGQGLAETQQGKGSPGSVTAVAWKGGNRISVIYANKNSKYVNTAELKEVRWIEGAGWQKMAQANKDWSGFLNDVVVTAVGWVDGRGTDQLRLYARWIDGGVCRFIEFIADSNGWTRQSADFASFTWGGILSACENPLSSVAWTFPTPDNVHIRLHFIAQDTGRGNPYAHEIEFDTGLGWKNSVDIDRT